MQHRPFVREYSTRVATVGVAAVLAAAFVFFLALNVFARPFKKHDQSKAPSRHTGLTISADTISRNEDTHTLQLNGHVHLHYQNEDLRCNEASVSTLTHEITAAGNVQIRNPKTYIEAKSIRYNYETKTGEFKDGSVESGNVLFLGKLIKKKSNVDYDAINAQFTSCVTCPPAWSFSGSEIKARLGGYARIKFPILRVGDFPILALPWLAVPLKTKRQSGFLSPLFGFSSWGVETGFPYFWAISRSQDATFTLNNYSKLGLKQNIEYRYNLGNHSKGQLEMAHVRDHMFTDTYVNSGGGQYIATKTMDRGFLSYHQLINLPDNYVNRIDLNLASDLRYPRDYYLDMPVWGDPAFVNEFSVTKNTERQNMSIQAAYYVNLLKADATASNNDAVNRFPEIDYSLIDTELGHTNLFYNMNFSYDDFARQDYSFDTAYDGPNGRTVPTDRCDPNVADCTNFDPNIDQIRTGQRFIFKPSISYPFHVSHFLDVDPSLTYDEMDYFFNAKPNTPVPNYSQNATRRYLKATVSARTEYSAVYGPNNGHSTRYKHSIVPEIIYSWIPWQQNPANLFFGNFASEPIWRRDEPISNADFTGSSKVQFDYLDRFFDENYTTFVLSNYLTRKTYVKLPDGTTVPNYFRFMTFRLSEGYDFHDASLPASLDPRPWSDARGLFDLRTRQFDTNTLVDYYPYAHISNWSSRVRYTTMLNNFFEIVYNDYYIVGENLDTAINRTQTIGAGIGYAGHYIKLVGDFNYAILPGTRFLFQSEDYSMDVKLPGNCVILKIMQEFNLGGYRQIGFNFKFNFG